jgi:hypothetical protein
MAMQASGNNMARIDFGLGKEGLCMSISGDDRMTTHGHDGCN